MIVYIVGYGPSFWIPVTRTSQIKHIRAVIKYYLRVLCDIALFYHGRSLYDGFEMHHFDIQDESTLYVELRFQTTSVLDDAHDAFYGSLRQQACHAFD